VLKVSVGMLRPNFLAVCQPNISCSSPEEFGVYHTDYVCQVQRLLIEIIDHIFFSKLLNI
jgi:hypothetical protein